MEAVGNCMFGCPSVTNLHIDSFTLTQRSSDERVDRVRSDCKNKERRRSGTGRGMSLGWRDEITSAEREV